MLGIVDCKAIDDLTEIEACSVQAASEDMKDEGMEHGWSMQRGKNTARLERRLLLPLLAASPGVSGTAGAVIPFGSGAADPSDENGALGWLVAVLLVLPLVWKMLSDKVEVRTRTRSVMVQGPVTYKVAFAVDGTNRSRYQPLPEHEFGAWTTAG